ncbi:MAG: hypothetical protein K5988_07980 [Lachnospiraceae bacterium]|nr:hypothetical protein [Lachnospiraceae bacterium]
MKDIILEITDLRHLNWAKTRKSSGTAGSFLKAYDDSGKRKKYYKLSDFDSVNGIIGHECVNEIVVQRLLDFFGIEHLKYTLVHALVTVDDRDRETYLCESEDYKGEGESKISLEDYYAMYKEKDESPFDFCKRMGWEQYVYEMFLIDYLVLNRDRHGANIEVLRDTKARSVRLAPLFDHGLSLVCRCHTREDLDKFDVTEDRKVQAFVGTSSTLENVKAVPKSYLNKLPKLTEEDLDKVFEGLNAVIGTEYIEKMRGMIWERWCSLDGI